MIVRDGYIRRAMLILQTLGGLAVRRGDEPLSRVSTQRKRLALLAVLATAEPNSVPRDRLLALLWPESDTERARTSLKQTVFALRRELGEPDLFVGTGELRLNANIIQSDVAAFVRAVAAKDHGSAVELYSGLFLDGIRIGDEPELEAWIENQRGRLHRLYRESLRALTEVASAGDNSALVRERWEDIVADNPADSSAASILINQLLSLGNVAGAREVAVRHDSFIKKEWGEVPEAPLVDVVEAWLSSHRDRIQAIEPETVSVTNGVAANRRFAIWSEALAVLAIILVGGSAVAIPMLHSSRENTALISIQPADASGLKDAPEIDAMLREMVATAAPVSRSDPHKTKSKTRFLLTERFARVGRSLHLNAELVDRDTVFPGDKFRRPTVEELSVDGTDEDAERLGAVLGVRVVGRILGASSKALADAATVSTASISALRNYVVAESQYRQGHYAVAADGFERAVAADSNFAVAWYRLSVTCDWAARTDCSFDAAHRAARLSQNLDEHVRLLVDGLSAWHSADREAAEHIYAYITAEYPDDAEAWYQLGDSRFHLGPYAGLPIQAAREPFERAIRLDSSGPEAYIHLARIATLSGNVRAADTLYARAISRSDAASRGELLVMRAFALHDSTAIRAFFEQQAPRESDEFLWTIAERLASYGGDLDGSQRVFRVLAQNTRTPATRSAAHTELGEIALIRGHFFVADSEFAIAGSFTAPRFAERYAVERRRLMRLLPDLSIGGLPAVRRLPTQSQAPPSTPRSEFSAPDLRDMAERRYGETPYLVDTFLDGLEAVGKRPAAVEGAVAALERITGPQRDSAMSLAGALRVASAVHSKEWNTVLKYVDLKLASPLWGPLMGIERYWYATALMNTGRHAEALQWFGSYEGVGIEQLAMAARAALRRAELMKALGDSSGAEHAYRMAKSVWKSADSSARPLLHAVR